MSLTAIKLPQRRSVGPCLSRSRLFRNCWVSNASVGCHRSVPSSTTGKLCPAAAGCHALFPTGSIHTLLVRLPYEGIVRIRPAVLLSLVLLLFGCTEQPTDYNAYSGPAPGSAYPAYGYSPGYLGPKYYGSDLVIGGGGYWASGKDRDPYWYRHRDQAWQRHGNGAQARAEAWQQIQQQKTAIQAAQVQAAVQQQQAVQQQAALAAQAVQQQRAAAQAAQAQALQERAQAVQQLYQQRAQAVAAQQQAASAAQAQVAMQQQQQRAAAQAAQAQALQERAQAVQQMYQQRAQMQAAQQQALAAARARGLPGRRRDSQAAE